MPRVRGWPLRPHKDALLPEKDDLKAGVSGLQDEVVPGSQYCQGIGLPPQPCLHWEDRSLMGMPSWGMQSPE